jgi:thiol:disulfide interchange protein DsbD
VIPAGRPHESPVGTNWWIESKATIEQRFQVGSGAVDGALQVQGTLQYMACTPEFCDPPAKDPFTATLTITGGAAAAAPAPAPVAPRGIQGLGDPPKVTLRPRFEPSPARAGERVRLLLEASVEDGWHVYGSAETESPPTELRDLEAAGLRARGDAVVPRGQKKAGPIGDSWILEGGFTVTQDLVVPDGTPPGEIEVKGSLGYQPCDENSCLMPTGTAFRGRLAVEAGAPRPEHAAGADAAPGNGGGTRPLDPGARPPDAGTRTPAPDLGTVALRQPKFAPEEEDWTKGSLWNLILLCIGGGLIALVMPCTYPMIPITFSFFTKQADARGGKVLPLALAYGAGIVGIFVVIGVAVGEVVIRFAAHWATNLVIGGAFVVFALALFGWINLQPPAFLTRAAGRASAAGGLLGVFLMGATLVVTSFTCTAPIVGGLLAGVAQGASRTDVAIGMGAFGLTMAAPFVFLALLPGRVKQLPKSGEWMNTLKVSLGFVELAAALKFVSNADIVLRWGILPREVFLSAWALLFLLLALYLFGRLQRRGEPAPGVSVRRMVFGVASLLFAVYCVIGASGQPLDFVMTAFEPNYQLRKVEEHAIVTDDHVAALELARQQRKYVLVNFTGFT